MLSLRAHYRVQVPTVVVLRRPALGEWPPAASFLVVSSWLFVARDRLGPHLARLVRLACLVGLVGLAGLAGPSAIAREADHLSEALTRLDLIEAGLEVGERQHRVDHRGHGAAGHERH